MPSCAVAINAHLQAKESETGVERGERISRRRSKCVIFCCVRTEGEGWTDGQIACFLHLATNVFFVVQSFLLRHCATVHVRRFSLSLLG